MSLSPLNSVASALQQLELQKSHSAVSAEKTLVAGSSSQAATSSSPLPVDTVSLSSAARHDATGDVDHDGDSH